MVEGSISKRTDVAFDVYLNDSIKNVEETEECKNSSAIQKNIVKRITRNTKIFGK